MVASGIMLLLAAVVPLWFAPRSAGLWRWLPTAVYGLAFLGLVAVLVGLAPGLRTTTAGTPARR